MPAELPPPIDITLVPPEYHPDQLPCQGGCLYADCMFPTKDEKAPWGLIKLVCAPRHGAQGNSSSVTAWMCNLSDCPWTKAKGDKTEEQRLLEMTAKTVAEIEDPNLRATNVNPTQWRRATVQTIFEYQDRQPQ